MFGRRCGLSRYGLRTTCMREQVGRYLRRGRIAAHRWGAGKWAALSRLRTEGSHQGTAQGRAEEASCFWWAGRRRVDHWVVRKPLMECGEGQQTKRTGNRHSRMVQEGRRRVWHSSVGEIISMPRHKDASLVLLTASRRSANGRQLPCCEVAGTLLL